MLQTALVVAPAWQMDIDPRTSLKIIEVPAQHSKYFSDLKDTVIHWMGVVTKFNRMWKMDTRVAVFSDQCIYLCRMDGGITRCVQVRNIEYILLSEGAAIGFRIQAPDYDMLLQFKTLADREAVMAILKQTYEFLVGSPLVTKQLSEEANLVLQQELNLNKPPGYVLRIEPIRTQKSLAKAIADQKRREEEDRLIVEREFERIKEGLHRELMSHRSEEHDRLVEQLANYTKALEDKDREIARIKRDAVSRDDPELWKHCPNCAKLQERLLSNPNDDKQKIIRLEREIENQRNLLLHLQAAIQHRSTAAAGQLSGSSTDNTVDAAVVARLRQDLADATRKNKELQQLIAQSPLLSTEAKQRLANISTQRDGAGTTSSYTADDWTSLVAEKDREIKHLKSVLRDSTMRHVKEIESIRAQFQRYDEQIVDYLEKVFSGEIRPSGRGGTAAQMARATADAARASADEDGASRHLIDSGGSAVPLRNAATSIAQDAAQWPVQTVATHADAGSRGAYFDPSVTPASPYNSSRPLQQSSARVAEYQDTFGARGANPAFSPRSSNTGISPIARDSFGAVPSYLSQRGLY